MSAPALAPLAADCMVDLAPLARHDAENGYALAHLVAALCAPLEPVWALARDGANERPAFADWLDASAAPAAGLAWLGQLRGERILTGTTDAAARAQILAAPNMNRGLVAALTLAAQATLTGAKSVVVTERTTSAYTLTVRTRTAETPDASATNAALQAAKPIGLVLTHAVSNEPVIDEGTLTIDGSSATATIDTIASGDV